MEKVILGPSFFLRPFRPTLVLSPEWGMQEVFAQMELVSAKISMAFLQLGRQALISRLKVYLESLHA